MKKCSHFIPHILFAALLIGMGAYGKITGAESAKGLFEMLNIFNQPEYIGRYMVGIGEALAAIGVFFIATRKVAAILGISIMLGAVFFHVTLIGGSPLIPIIIIALGLWILNDATCRNCKGKKCPC